MVDFSEVKLEDPSPEHKAKRLVEMFEQVKAHQPRTVLVIYDTGGKIGVAAAGSFGEVIELASAALPLCTGLIEKVMADKQKH